MGKFGARFEARFSLNLLGIFPAFFLAFFLAACAPKGLDQAALNYVKDSANLAPAGFSEQLKKEYLGQFFSVWDESFEPPSKKAMFWGLEAKNGFDESKKPIGAAFFAEIEKNMRPESYPSQKTRGIMTKSTAVRVLPTAKPRFLSKDGYPFDRWQNSHIFAFTPVIILHEDASGEWLLVQSSFVSGWVRFDSVAKIRDKDADALKNAAEFAMPKKDKIPLYFKGRFVETARVGMLFEKNGGKIYGYKRDLEGFAVKIALETVRGESGESSESKKSESSAAARAESGESWGNFGGESGESSRDFAAQSRESSKKSRGVSALKTGESSPESSPESRPESAPNANDFATFPLTLSQANIAAAMDALELENYGWGGLYGNRDCSAFVRDVFMNFALWLPRNSLAQIIFTKTAPYAQYIELPKDSAAKIRAILKLGKPFATLLWMRGHIMLFIGEIEGKPVVMHDVWGIRGANGLDLISRIAITTLDSTGDVFLDAENAPAPSLLERIEAMGVLVK